MFWFRLSAQKQEEKPKRPKSKWLLLAVSLYGHIQPTLNSMLLVIFVLSHSFVHQLAHSIIQWLSEWVYYFASTMDNDRQRNEKSKKHTYENRHTVVMHVPLTQRADNVSFHTYYTTTSKFMYFALLARALAHSYTYARTHASTYAYIMLCLRMNYNISEIYPSKWKS